MKERIESMKEMIGAEKETREMWVARYEKEQQEHTMTNAQFLHTKADLKDQVLATKDAEIKLQTVSRQADMYSEQNKRL